VITLNSDRGFVKVECWEDIEELPGFTGALDPKQHELKEIIGRYIFKDYIKCGLSSCHTPHGKGYIVSTKSGPITNIGHNCGKNHFHIEFDELSKSFEKSISLHNYRENIGSFLIHLDTYKEALENLRAGQNGADYLFKKGQLLVKKGGECPDSAVSIFSKLVRNKNPNLFRARKASKKEIEDLEAIQGKELPRPYYIEEEVGVLKGLSFLYEENDLRKLIMLDLNEGFKAIGDLDIDNGNFKDLKHWSAWCSTVETKLNSIQEIIKIAPTLLNKDNLLQLTNMIDDPLDETKYKAFIKNRI
jgi:hypothetical protein